MDVLQGEICAASRLMNERGLGLVHHVAPHVFRQLLQEQRRCNPGAGLGPASTKHLNARHHPVLTRRPRRTPTCFTDCCVAKKVPQPLQRHLTVWRFGLV